MGWIFRVFDTLTGVRLIQEGKIASFLQATRSKNALVIPLLMISGRTLTDCVFLAGLSFFLPWYVNGTTTTSSFYLCVCVFIELYFEKKCEELAARFPYTIGFLMFGARGWLLWILRDLLLYKHSLKNEETLARVFELSTSSS